MHFYESLKSRKELSSFILYCQNHPEERFWQALHNWSEYPTIYASIDYSPLERHHVNITGIYDTFDFKGRRHDEES
jgi:hypothetical protein